VTTEDKIAEAYERGYYVATQRAISRQELGLSLDRPSTDAELRSATHGYTITLDESAQAVQAIVDAYWESEDGQAELAQRAHEYMGTVTLPSNLTVSGDTVFSVSPPGPHTLRVSNGDPMQPFSPGQIITADMVNRWRS